MTNFKEIERALHLLAKRIKPSFKYLDDEQWYNVFHDYAGSGFYRCLICDHSIIFDDAYSNIEELQAHAVKHIKENNLTAFL